MHKRYIDLSVFHEFNMKAKQEILIFTLHFYWIKHFWSKIITHTHVSTC